jgi:periplasmic divalent cation tolerance protein
MVTDLETLMIFKVADDRLDAMMARLKVLHPYELPEVLVLAVDGGSEAYMAWVNREGRPLPRA